MIEREREMMQDLQTKIEDKRMYTSVGSYMCVCVWLRVDAYVCTYGMYTVAARECLYGRLIQRRIEWRVAADVIFARLMSLMESGAYLAGATQFTRVRLMAAPRDSHQRNRARANARLLDEWPVPFTLLLACLLARSTVLVRV